ncbi:bride of sevenless [Nesidiocoris tenuis]|uniref:Bride of sevenless n=2 Tax=Nesidiocoris tenuis TaxID=355587 RepID=A0ABN7AXB3_9HEMI|nr:bride of sevenless [Nesidiocoris tenuis]
MHFHQLKFLLLFLPFGSATKNDTACQSTIDNSIYKTPGDVMITGFFNAHSGDNCSFASPQTHQTISAVVRAFEIVQRRNAIQGVKIGLSIYETCSSKELAQKSMEEAIADADCSDSSILGGLVDESTYDQVRNFGIQSGFPLNPITGPSTQMMARISARVLHHIKWAPVHYLVTETAEMRHELLAAMTTLNICVYHTLPFEEMYKIGPGGGTIVMMGKFSYMKNSSHELRESKVLFISTDEEFETVPDLTSSKVLIVLPSQLEYPAVDNPFNLTDQWPEDFGTDLLKTPSRTSMRQMLLVNDLWELVNSLKYQMQIHCQEQAVCPGLPRLLARPIAAMDVRHSSENDIRKALIISRVEESDFISAVVLEQQFAVGGSLAFNRLGSVKLVDGGWHLETKMNVSDVTVFCKNIPTNDSTGLDCTKCMNFEAMYREYFAEQERMERSKPVIVLKDEAWVAAFLSVSTVGVLCCCAIFAFIVVRICKKDMLEGHPGFSFLMLLAVIFMYACVLPFSVRIVENNAFLEGILCGLKLLGTSLSYCLVYSVMLARSLMLASCDENGGFMSHINGYLQTVLCFFIAAVQIALTIQFWAMNWLLLDEEQCAYMSQGSLFLYLMGYDVFLLVLLVCLSPFVFRSKRNYHEGGYFSVAVLLCVLVWIGWCTSYVLLPQWADLFVCCGLVGTGSVILVTIFIPRTYLMLTGFVRDHIVSTLPSLAHTTATSAVSVTDVHYRSNQALYDSVQAVSHRGQVNPNYYAESPPTPSTSKMEDNDGNYYERYDDRSPSPLTVTRF